ncbi:hypothetical protein ACTUSR_08210 [Pantoea stewartii subsp. indologenes]|uniref:hypothetical protein n=1 Tax=Pantoea stewartii TaxID=66269 RepID=UPI003FA42131
MSDVIYQYQQGYTPNNGNTFYFWVDCTKEFHDEEANEGGTVRALYAEPKDERQRFEDAVMLISRGLADLTLAFDGKYSDPGIQVFWENAQVAMVHEVKS